MAENVSHSGAGDLSARAAAGSEDFPEAGPALREALECVPGYVAGDSDVAVVRLSGGRVNRSYRVATRAGQYVLRFSPVTDAWLAADRSVERALHARAAAAGIAPRIVEADGQDRWMITELVVGRLWSAEDFASPGSLGQLADTLRRLHALETPSCGRFDLLLALRAYVDRIRPADGSLGACLEQAERAWRLSGASRRAVTIVHHDLHASNLIESPEGLRLIDWECAAVSDPLLDLACVLSYYESAWACAPMFLERVGLRGVETPQLRAAVWLFDLHTWLWYRERRQRLAPTQAELDAEGRLSLRIARGPTG